VFFCSLSSPFLLFRFSSFSLSVINLPNADNSVSRVEIVERISFSILVTGSGALNVQPTAGGDTAAAAGICVAVATWFDPGGNKKNKIYYDMFFSPTSTHIIHSKTTCH